MRWQRVRISSPLLLGMFTQGNRIDVLVEQGLPADAKFVRIIDTNIYGLELIVESESFPLLNDGDHIPLFPDIRVRRVSDVQTA